jgi:cobalamin biosynthesis Mg chelatase CobN
MRRLMYIAALALAATLVFAPGASAQQMGGEHMMPNGQMMPNSMMVSPSASASATPSAKANGQMMNGNNMMASPSASASASPSATATASTTATASNMATAKAPRTTAKAPRTTAKAPRTHHGDSGNSASAADSDRLPSTGGVPWVPLVSVGALVLLMGFGLAAYRLLRRSA